FGARSTQRLTYQLRLALEPECLENPTATAREDPRMERTRSETLKLSVVSDVNFTPRGRRSNSLKPSSSSKSWGSAHSPQRRRLRARRANGWAGLNWQTEVRFSWMRSENFQSKPRSRSYVCCRSASSNVSGALVEFTLMFASLRPRT